MSNNDSHKHIVKTSEQWNDRVVEYWTIPRGCLCVELTPKGETKIKIGEGNKYYSQLPYICDHGDLSQYYTKDEIDILFENFNKMAIMSTEEYASKSDLPMDGNKLGDVRFVKSASPSIKTDPDIYLWNGSKWVFVGYEFKDIDISQYLKKDEFHEIFDPVKEQVDEMYPMRHTHENKDILDQTTASYTAQEKEKLADLENYDDTEIRELIHDTGHTHPNKVILDTITTESLWSESDRNKFEALHNYDDSQIKVRIEFLENISHTHPNKDILDTITTDSLWSESDREKFEKLDNLEEFVGTDGRYPGHMGLVPAPKITDIGKFLSSSGTWLNIESASDFIGATDISPGVHGLVPAPNSGQQSYFLKGDGTWGEIPIGTGLMLDEHGNIITVSNVNGIVYDNQTNTLSISYLDGSEVTVPISSGTGGGLYRAGDGISIDASDDLICKNQEYYFDYQVQCQIRSDHLSPSIRTRTFTKLNSSPAFGAVMKFHHPQVSGDMISPMFVSTDPDAVAYNNSYDSMVMEALGPFRYLGRDWYYTSFDRGMEYGVGDLLGNMPSLTDNVYTYDTLVDAAKYLIDTAEPIIAQEISARLGTGLKFDNTGSIELDETIKLVLNCNYDE